MKLVEMDGRPLHNAQTQPLLELTPQGGELKMDHWTKFECNSQILHISLFQTS